jgi:uncharacterized protein with von Willebrand factor type A (vWA) domain
MVSARNTKQYINPMINKFDSFIKFGSILDREKRAGIATLIYEQLQNNKSVFSLSDETTDNFANAVKDILSNKTMGELCSKDSALAEQVTTEILDYITKTKMYLQRSEDTSLKKEQNILDKFKQTNKDSFAESWEAIAPFVKETYEQHILDTEFYYGEFKKSLIPSNEDKNKISFRSVKEHFADKWEKLLFEKKLKWELDIIDKERKEFCKLLYERIDNLKKLKELLEPFTNELGRLWDMSKGRWQKVNFDILEKYAELLKKDESLQKLAEMLGRMRQAEREYEEEIFADMVIKPAWKAEHAAKSELVGIHESDDISSMLPAEAALLADDETELLFYKKFAEKKLQTFEYQAKVLSLEEEEINKKRQKEKEEKKGPFIICVDTSASMHGTPEIVAKTLCFALLKMAVRDNRKCYLISFSTAIETLNLTDLKNNLEKLIEFLSISFQGGTDAGPAMQETLRMLETEDYQKADVVMVSDFVMSSFDKQIKKQIVAAKEKKTKFHSLVIDDSGNKSTIDEFDTNWAYNKNNSDCVLQLVRDIHSYSMDV